MTPEHDITKNLSAAKTISAVANFIKYLQSLNFVEKVEVDLMSKADYDCIVLTIETISENRLSFAENALKDLMTTKGIYYNCICTLSNKAAYYFYVEKEVKDKHKTQRYGYVFLHNDTPLADCKSSAFSTFSVISDWAQELQTLNFSKMIVSHFKSEIVNEKIYDYLVLTIRTNSENISEFSERILNEKINNAAARIYCAKRVYCEPDTILYYFAVSR